MSKRKIYIVGNTGYEYANWCEGKIVKSMEDADMVLLTGGEDVSPQVYGKKAHPTTGFNMQRDAYEFAEFKAAVELGKPVLGICRGAQVSCCMAGGTLIQHSQHPYLHDVTTDDGRTIHVTSSHHQRQYIKDLGPDKAHLIAWAEHLSPFSYGESYDDEFDEEQEAEIVYYPEIRALACQSHPEWVFPGNEEWERVYIDYCRELITKYLKV